jgi:hypothetical protein
MEQQIKPMKTGKSQKNQPSEFSTTCNSPEIYSKVNKDFSSINSDIRSRRYSLPLNKIINLNLEDQGGLFKEMQTFEGSRLEFLSTAGFDGKKKNGLDLKRKTFLIDEINEKMMKKLKMKIVEHRIIFNGPRNVQRKYKPSRFAPLSDMKNPVVRPTVKLNRKSLDDDLKLVFQNKFDKVKADFNMERLLSYRLKTRQKPGSVDIEESFRVCSPLIRKTVKFDC